MRYAGRMDPAPRSVEFLEEAGIERPVELPLPGEGALPDAKRLSDEQLEALLIHLEVPIPFKARIPLPVLGYAAIFHGLERRLRRARHLAPRQKPVERLPLFRWREERARAQAKAVRRRRRLENRTARGGARDASSEADARASMLRGAIGRSG